MSIETMVYAAIFILGFALLIIFISYKFAPAAEELGNKGIISNWVLQTSKFKTTKIVFQQGISQTPPVSSLLKEPIKINTKEELIKNHKLLADTMLHCFEAFDKGETDFLYPLDIISEPFCFSCAVIEFDKDLIGQNLSFLKEYIKIKSPILTKKDETYDILLKQQYHIPDKIEEDKAYIFFTASTNTVWNRYLNARWILLSGFEPTIKNPINAKIILNRRDKILEYCAPVKDIEIKEIEAERKWAETIEELMGE